MGALLGVASIAGSKKSARQKDSAPLPVILAATPSKLTRRKPPSIVFSRETPPLAVCKCKLRCDRSSQCQPIAAGVAAPSGFHSKKRRPWISSSPSMWGMPTFRTAGVPSARCTATTYEQVPSPLPSGAWSVNDHCRCSLCSVLGKRSSHAVRSRALPQLNASPRETLSVMLLIVSYSPRPNFATRHPEEACGKREISVRNAVDNCGQILDTCSAMVVPFCWTGGYAL